jgi:hypothetical protein
LEKIATRFRTTTETIKYYEKIFFHVRDRLDTPTWIAKVIRDPIDSIRHRNSREYYIEQRGYALKLFGYFGGPLVLDAVVAVVNEAQPKDSKDLHNWFQAVTEQSVQLQATVAASTIHLDRRNSLEFVKLALNHRRATKASKEQQKAADDYLAKVVAWMTRKTPTSDDSKKPNG